MCSQVRQLFVLDPGTQSVVHRPTASGSPGSLLEMQTLRPPRDSGAD